MTTVQRKYDTKRVKERKTKQERRKEKINNKCTRINKGKKKKERMKETEETKKDGKIKS
jgi:hypothetical protein